MISLRTISMLFALALAGCAQSSSPGPYYSDSNASSGWGQPVNAGYGGWGSSYGYGGNSSYGQSVLFRPARGITCDRSRELCYDRYGLDYYATQRYFGERDANRAVKKYGEQVFLFQPKRGVSCDRRTRTCSDAGGLDVDWTDDVFGDKSERKVTNWLAGDSFVPERHVTCVPATKVCADQNGPSISLTQVYFGRAAAQDLADQLGPGAPGASLAPPMAEAAPPPEPEIETPAVSPLTEALQGDQPAPLPMIEAPQEVPPIDVAAPIVEEPIGSSPVGPEIENVAPQDQAMPAPLEQPIVQLEPETPEAMPEPILVPQPEFQPEPEPMPQAAPQVEPAPQPAPAPQPEPAPVADSGGSAPACADPAACAAQ